MERVGSPASCRDTHLWSMAQILQWDEWGDTTMNRRDVLKLGGAAFIATMIPDQLVKLMGAQDIQSAIERLSAWDLPVQAAVNNIGTPVSLRRGMIWNGQLNTGMPDLYATHRMPRLPQFARDTYTAFRASDWPDSTDVPLTTWYQKFADALRADTAALNQCPQGWFQFDLESFDVTTNSAARQASAAKYVTVYNGIKAVLPELNFSFYSYPNINDYNTAGFPQGSAQYTTFQGKMEDFAAMYSVVPCVFPKVYIPYTRSGDNPQTVSNLRNFFRAEIRDTYRMIRKYGNGQPVYPFVNYTKAADGSTVADQDIFEEAVRICMQEADGMVCWGGFTVPWSTESALPWFKYIEAHIVAQRFWAPAVPR